MKQKLRNEKDSKQLLRFVKSPGLKTTIVKVDKEDLKFYPLDLRLCRIARSAESILEIRKELMLECDIRSLFDENEVLPIKHAHITVEIHVK